MKFHAIITYVFAGTSPMISARQSFAGLQQFLIEKQDDGANRLLRKDTVYYDNVDEMQVKDIISRNQLETGDLAGATGKSITF
jgi:hypothetical protein